MKLRIAPCRFLCSRLAVVTVENKASLVDPRRYEVNQMAFCNEDLPESSVKKKSQLRSASNLLSDLFWQAVCLSILGKTEMHP